MVIDRHNYEEYFLLYVDNELSASERQMVEHFVEQNPDLRSELEVLQKTKLVADDETIAFKNKSALHKEESAGINIHNYEEYFLLYIDRELSDTKRKEVEKFVLQHPHLQRQFELLKQTILEPKTIEFPEKNSLYRRTERRIPAAWMQVSAAAAVIGLAVFTWWMMPNQKNIEFANTNKPENKTEQPKKNSAATATSDNNLTQQQEKSTEKKSETFASNQKKKASASKNENKKAEEIHETNIQPDNAVVTLNKKSNEPVKIDAPADEIKVQDEIAIEAPFKAPETQQESNLVSDITAFEDTKKIASDYNTLSDNIVHPVVYKELNTNDEEGSINIGSMQINKNKVKGFLKKAGSLFSKKAKNTSEDEKLKVANFEINTN